MIQEYIALLIFSGALIFTIVSLIRFVSKFRSSQGAECGSDCHCSGSDQKKMIPEYLKDKNFKYKHVSLK